MKKWLTMMSVLVLVFITACGGGNNNEPAASSSAAPSASASPSAEPDEVVVWTYPVQAKYETEINELIADFNKEYPHIKVKVEMLSWAEGPKKFDVALNAGNPPDLYFHSVDGMYVNTGLAVQLDEFLTPEIKADYMPGTLELAQIQGKQYGLPLYQFIWAWGGNKRILEEAGIDWKKIQKDGWTWTEFKEAAKKMTKKLPDGSTQYGFVTDGTSGFDFIELVTRANNMPDVLDENGKFQWNDNRIVEALTFIKDLIAAGSMPKETAAIEPKKRLEMFYAGQAGVISKAIPYYDVLVQTRNADIDAGKVQGEKIDFVLLPVPHGDNAPSKTIMGAEGYVMFKQKKDKGPEHTKNAFLVMEALSGAKAGSSANELVLPFVRKSQAEMFKDKGMGTPDTIEAAKIMAEQYGSLPVTLKLDVDLAAKMKQFKEQVVKPNIQALYASEKTPEAIAEDFISKGKQIFGQ